MAKWGKKLLGLAAIEELQQVLFIILRAKKSLILMILMMNWTMMI